MPEGTGEQLGSEVVSGTCLQLGLVGASGVSGAWLGCAQGQLAPLALGSWRSASRWRCVRGSCVDKGLTSSFQEPTLNCKQTGSAVISEVTRCGGSHTRRGHGVLPGWQLGQAGGKRQGQERSCWQFSSSLTCKLSWPIPAVPGALQLQFHLRFPEDSSPVTTGQGVSQSGVPGRQRGNLPHKAGRTPGSPPESGLPEREHSPGVGVPDATSS